MPLGEDGGAGAARADPLSADRASEAAQFGYGYKWGWDTSIDYNRLNKSFSQKTLSMYNAYAECSANPMIMVSEQLLG